MLSRPAEMIKMDKMFMPNEGANVHSMTWGLLLPRKYHTSNKINTSTKQRVLVNIPPVVAGAKAEVEPARAARTASFIMVGIGLVLRERSGKVGERLFTWDSAISKS